MSAMSFRMILGLFFGALAWGVVGAGAEVGDGGVVCRGDESGLDAGNAAECYGEDGGLQGWWVLRGRDGSVSEGLMVDDLRQGRWVVRFEDGRVVVSEYVDGVVVEVRHEGGVGVPPTKMGVGGDGGGR